MHAGSDASGSGYRVGTAANADAGAALKAGPQKVEITVDGTTWFAGRATCVLVESPAGAFGGVPIGPVAVRVETQAHKVTVTVTLGRPAIHELERMVETAIGPVRRWL